VGPSPSTPAGAGDDESAVSEALAGTAKKAQKKVDKYQAALDQNRKIAEALNVVRRSHEGVEGPEDGYATAMDGALATLKEFNVDASLALVPQSYLIPHPLTDVVKADISRRNYLNLERWYCLSRPQYSKSCGVSSLTSIWNYLYSTLGPTGTLPPISQEFVMSTILGFQPPFEAIRWGPFTGNVSLMKWFYKINAHFGIKRGKAFFMWKKLGTGRTFGLSDADAEAQTKQWLQDPNAAIIYHCKNHYMVPIGYQEQPRAPRLAYAAIPGTSAGSSAAASTRGLSSAQTSCAPSPPFGTVTASDFDTILLIGEPSRGIHPPIHCRKFSDVATDLGTGAPFIFNIRHPERGVERAGGAKSAAAVTAEAPVVPPPPPSASKRFGTSIHCFLGFRSDVDSGDAAAALEAGSDSDDNDDE
jgi:hypothetical protein